MPLDATEVCAAVLTRCRVRQRFADCELPIGRRPWWTHGDEEGAVREADIPLPALERRVAVAQRAVAKHCRAGTVASKEGRRAWLELRCARTALRLARSQEHTPPVCDTDTEFARQCARAALGGRTREFEGAHTPPIVKRARRHGPGVEETGSARSEEEVPSGSRKRKDTPSGDEGGDEGGASSSFRERKRLRARRPGISITLLPGKRRLSTRARTQPPPKRPRPLADAVADMHARHACIRAVVSRPPWILYRPSL